ncbi:MAG: tRNA-dihydrouridine synthase [Clostridiales bacterium]|nr:tRNA-dihydrouridine synthase [Clostridiales bacterium]
MSVRIGKIDLGELPVCLSPMAGTSSVTFRGICCENGASYCPTELTSARSIVYNGFEKSFRFMEIDPSAEKVTCIQLFGSESEDFVYAIDAICSHELLGQVDIIDINMGCPVSKVVKTGAGSALIKDPERAGNIVTKAVKAASSHNKALTVKTRIGFAADDRSGPEFARVLAGSGAMAITVHGRTASQMYHGVADHDAVAAMREAVREFDIPFFANGDVTDGESARRILDKTGADGLMIGRAAMGDPWIFGRVNAYLQGKETPLQPTPREKCDMMLRELEGTASHIGEKTAVKEMRSVYPHYIKGLPGAASFKNELMTAVTVEDVRKIIEKGLALWT